MSTTRTGKFPIGFRRGGSAWQKDLSAVIAFAKQADFSGLDLCTDGDTAGQEVLDAGLEIGSVDLPDWRGLLAADAGKRKESVARNADYIKACSPLGQVNYFSVMPPDDPEVFFADNFKYMTESYGELAETFIENDARLVIEGYPGKGFLCCTPESYRLFFAACPCKNYGVNYDPSHLIRQGIDPIRFLREFVERVFHVHGKDTEINQEALYELGHEHPPTLAVSVPYGGSTWRYTIPGHGCFRWTECFSILQEAGYAGRVSVELEDYHFNGTEAGEKNGLILSRQFLAGC